MGQQVSSSVSSCYFTPRSYPMSPQHVDNPHRDVFPRDLGTGEASKELCVTVNAPRNTTTEQGPGQRQVAVCYLHP